MPQSYLHAFDEIDADKKNFLAVIELDAKIIGVLQLTFIRYLTYQCGKRALIEGVRIDEIHRGQEIGKNLLSGQLKKRERKVVI